MFTMKISRITAAIVTFAFVLTQCGLGIAAPIIKDRAQNLRQPTAEGEQTAKAIGGDLKALKLAMEPLQAVVGTAVGDVRAFVSTAPAAGGAEQITANAAADGQIKRLLADLGNPDSEVRAQAARAAGEMVSDAARKMVPALLDRLENDPNASVRAAIAKTLLSIATGEMLNKALASSSELSKLATELLRLKSGEIRVGHMGDDDLRAFLTAFVLIGDGKDSNTIAQLGPNAVPALRIAILRDENPAVRAGAVVTLGNIIEKVNIEYRSALEKNFRDSIVQTGIKPPAEKQVVVLMPDIPEALSVLLENMSGDITVVRLNNEQVTTPKSLNMALEQIADSYGVRPIKLLWFLTERTKPLQYDTNLVSVVHVDSTTMRRDILNILKDIGFDTTGAGLEAAQEAYNYAEELVGTQV